MNSQNLAATATGSNPNTAPKDRKIPAVVRARIWFVRWFLVTWIHLFSMSGLYRLGQFFGTLEYLTDYKRRRRVHALLRQYFNEEHPASWYRDMVKRYFMRIRCDKMFYTIMDRIPRGKLMNRIKLIGRENLDDAMSRGKGAYVALCHFGSFHVAGLMTAMLGYEIIGVRDAKESNVRRYIQNKYRETFPEVAAMKMFLAGSFPRQIYRALHANKVVASLLDVGRSRGENLKTQQARIFSEERDFLIGPIQIALRCETPVLQGLVESRRNFYYRIVITPPLIPPETDAQEDDNITKIVQQYAHGVETFAREHPDHVMNI